MITLHLTLKKKWFDMIASGEKKEEYREIKPYWIKRLCSEFGSNHVFEHVFRSKKFDTVTFKNGYAKDAPTLVIEWRMLVVRKGRPEWGAEPGKKYFVIKLGERL